MGELKRRMEEDLRLRNRSPRTITSYLSCVQRLALFFMTRPDQLDAPEVRSFLLDLQEAGASPAARKMHVAALRFFFRVTAARPDIAEVLVYPRVPPKQPYVPSRHEVMRLIDATSTPKHRALVVTAYGAGLRLGELRHLQAQDILSAEGLIAVRRGKGARNRFVMLGRSVLDELRGWWRVGRPRGDWLFYGRRHDAPISDRAVQHAVRAAAARAGIAQRLTPHSLRHAFATHMLADGVDLAVLQALLGHARSATTRHYLHVGIEHVRGATSPLDRTVDAVA